MSEADLLAADRFAARLGAKLVEVGDRVVLDMEPRDDHRDSNGAVSAAVLFSLADCAMSLISNSDRTAVAIATHLAVSDVLGAGRLRVVAQERMTDSERARTWDIEILADEVRAGLFVGTTWTVG